MLLLVSLLPALVPKAASVLNITPPNYTKAEASKPALPAYARRRTAGLRRTAHRRLTPDGVARNGGSAAHMLGGAATMSSGAARLAPSQPHYAPAGELITLSDALL